MHKATSKKLAFKLLAATASLGVTSALVMVNAPSVHAAQVGGVQGTVKDANGLPIKGAQILLIPTGGGAPQPARTDSSGYYSFAGIQPGTYTLEVNVVTFVSGNQNVTVTQDVNSTLDFSLAKKEVGRVGTGGRIAPTNRNGTDTHTPITARDEQREKSQPNNLYQFTGLLNYKPGVTEDSGQYPHLRGSDQNQINYEVDGIDVRDPIFNQFATNLVTVGIRSANVITGGASAEFGGAAGGYLNAVTVNGRDIAPNKPVGGFFESTFGPNGGWAYRGLNTQIGGVLLNKKLDYAFSSIDFSTRYPGNFQLSELHSSQDSSGKINYYASPNDLVTLYYEHGSENYNNYQTSSNSLFFDPDRLLTDPTTGRQYYSVRDLGTNFNDHSVQTNDLEHFTYKHNFSSNSFLQARVYQLHQGTPGHSEGVLNNFNFLATNITGTQLDYSNQLSKSNIFKTGIQYTDDKGSYFRQIVNVQTGPLDPKNNPSYADRIYAAYPKDFALYLADQIRALDNKLTLDLGARFNSVTYKAQDSKYLDSIGQSNPSGYTTKSTDPRLGLGYSPSPDLTFRTSYGINSQRADARRIQRVAPIDVGAIGTNIGPNPLSQSKSDYSVLPLNHIKLSHAKDFDFGVEKAVNLNNGIAQGAYLIGVTGYTKYVYDLAYLNSANYDLNAGSQTPYLYSNDGKSHVSGVEVSLRKRLVRPSDWNGYINYTNQVARANVLSANAYFPTFTNAESGNPFFTDSANDAAAGITTLPGRDLRALNHTEFPTDADQRHTVSVVVGKRLSRLFDVTFVMDAGSGLPYFGTATNDGTFGGSVGPGFAATHTITGGDSNFTQVPIILSGNTLAPVNPVSGFTGWHYKFGVNSNFNLTENFSLFLNVDNIFDKKTALSNATGTLSGNPYWSAPTAQYPQGQEHFGPSSILTPVFVTFGFRQKF